MAVGAIASKVGGGSAENGAMSAAFEYLFNQLKADTGRGCLFFCTTTVEAFRRGTTTQDAIEAGRLFREFTAPAIAGSLGAVAATEWVGVVWIAAFDAMGYSTASNITVSRWGREGLEAGDWVMTGGKNWVNYGLSAKWQPGMTNQFAPYASGASYQVPANAVRWPSGWGLDGAWKGIFGQRVYIPK